MSLVGASVGSVIGLCLSAFTMVVLTMISTDKVLNIYFGLCFLFLGVMMLAKLYRKNRIVHIEVSSESNVRDYEVDFETNSLIKKPANKGGLASDLIHSPFNIKESTIITSN